MGYNTGALSATDILTTMDALGGAFKQIYPYLGVGAPGEASTSLVNKFLSARVKILGDGTTANPGLSNISLKGSLASILQNGAVDSRYDNWFASHVRQPIFYMDQIVSDNIPSGLTYSSGNSRVLDLYISRLNGNNPSVPATPSATPSLAATTGGSIDPTTTGAEPRVKFTHISASGDWLESQPSPASSQVALTGKNNAWTCTIAGTVPAGVGKLGVYRQLDNNAGSSDPFYLDQIVTVTAGASYPSITLKKQDWDLRQDWTPPVWMSCPLLPEEAFLMAIAYASVGTGGLSQFSSPAFSGASLITPSNVVLNPVWNTYSPLVYEFLGLFNPNSNGEFARWVNTAFTAGAVPTTNDTTQGLQGFAGAYSSATNGVRAHVIAALNGSGQLCQITYTYVDAANPTTPQTASTSALGINPGTVDIKLNMQIPTGRLVKTVTAISMTGTGVTTGTVVIEGTAPRAL